MANNQKGNVLAIAVMFMLFFMIAFVTNFAGSMGVIVQNQFGSVRFQGYSISSVSFSITVIQDYAPVTKAKEAEVEQFYEDL